MPRGSKADRAGRRWPFVVAAVSLAACGAGWAISAQADADRPGVAVQTETPATRDEMISDLRALLTEHGQRPPDTSDLATEDIRDRLEQARIRYAEPAEMPVVPACDGIKSVFDPDCW
ncbi:hypothetical protein [Streptomyces sp. S.PNR 29]|uniref:hypothetical protein n=1 Tax=Streptomyces sp. S.PNR 29 TaxID=2973805 RepID=UPI0025B18CA2|nr:hypothetical protein [Streptomyces sp. S.PNR 29]MDN0194540.1 hypothetical protein [Streptomyces sp. S.PNR 29]